MKIKVNKIKAKKEYIIRLMATELLKREIKDDDVSRILKIINLWKRNLSLEKFDRIYFFHNHKVSLDDKLVINALLDTVVCASILLYG